MHEAICEEEYEKILLKTINKLKNYVVSTYGPHGKQVLISKNGESILTKDGVTVAKAVFGDSATENAILAILKQCAEKTVKDAGDGPQPLYSKILTPNGFVEMGSLKIGDKICGTNNSIQEVLDIYPKGVKRIYKLHFSNNRTVECCLDHLWSVVLAENECPKKILTTKQLFDSTIKRKTSDGSIFYKYYTPITCVDFHDQHKELDPFLVGLLIGDGSLCSNGSIELSLSSYQEYILDKLILPDNIKYTYTKDPQKNYLRVKFSRKNKEGPTMHEYVNKIGLLNKRSEDKFIPKQYLYSSYENRIALLNGLIESDGYINQRGYIEYSTISSQLCQDFTELMRGLGRQVHVKFKKRKGDSYSNTPIFVITELKGYKYGIKLKEIEETNQYTEMMCIKVSNPDSLYITNDYIVTHNTTTSILLLKEFIHQILFQLKVAGSKISRMDVYNMFKENIVNICRDLEMQAVEISNKKMIYDVALVASNGDAMIAKLVSELIDHVGVNGNISIKESKNNQSSIQIMEGLRFNSSILATSFLPDNIDKLVLNDCVVVVSNSKIQWGQEIMDLLGGCIKNKKSILFVCPDMEEKLLLTIALNVERKNVNACVLTPAYLGHEKLEILEDIALTVGTHIGQTALLSRSTIDEWGYCRLVEVTRGQCTLIDGKASPAIIEASIESLKKRLQESEDEILNNRLINRINRLTSTVGILFIGGVTPAEIVERKHRAEDAVESCNSALKKGIVPGGGIALLLSSKNVLQINNNDVSFKNAVSTVMKNICESQAQSLYGNDFKEAYIKEDKKILLKDLRTGSFEDYLEKGIVESVWTIQSALQNAFATAWLLCNSYGALVQ